MPTNATHRHASTRATIGGLPYVQNADHRIGRVVFTNGACDPASMPKSVTTLDPRTPVVVGVGVACERPRAPGEGREALGLMLAATGAAGEDSGAPRLLTAVERVAVPHGTWAYSDP